MRWLRSAAQGAAGLTLALGLALGSWATAQAEEEKPATKLEDVVVRGAGETFTGIEATSATVLDNAQIVDRVYTEVIDMIKLSPGVHVSHYTWGGGSSGLKMRGFGNIGHSRDGVISLDGVLINDLRHADTSMIIPEEVERVEIVKGPASVLYGNFASAGSIAFNTFKAGDFTRLKLQYGSFNTQDAVAVIARKEGDWDHVYAMEARHTDGYQNNSQWDKQVAAGRWTYHVNDRLDAFVGVRGYNATWGLPGYLPQKLYDSNPGLGASDVGSGYMKWGMLQGGLDYRLNEVSKLKLTTWFNGSDMGYGYQYYITPTMKPGSNYGTDSLYDRDAYGVGLAYDYQGQVLERHTRLTLGLDVKREHEISEQWNLTVGGGRNRASKFTNDDGTLDTASLYGELNYQVFKPLRFVLGGRYDHMDAALDSTLRAKSSYERDGQGVFSPKTGLILTVHEGWDIFANVSKGFTLPALGDYMAQNLEPAIRTQYETGLRAKPNRWSDYGLIFWRLDTTDDFMPKLSDPSVQENAGETRRQGVEVESNFYCWRHLRLHLDYAYIDTEYLKFVQGGARRDGNELPAIPHHIFNAEVAWQPPLGWGGRLGYRYVSDWYLEAANLNKADGYGTVNAQVSYRFDKRYKLALDLINLFDKKYSEYMYISDGTRYYGVGDPLSFYLTFTIDW